MLTVLVPASLAAVDLDLGWLGDVAPLVDLGLSGVLIGVIIWLVRKREALVSSGEWVPRRELDYIRADRDARLAEKDREIARERTISGEWRAAHETSERNRELQDQQLRDALDALRGTGAFFDAFRNAAARSGPAGNGEGGP